jgi:copper chaperone CopZ
MRELTRSITAVFEVIAEVQIDVKNKFVDFDENGLIEKVVDAVQKDFPTTRRFAEAEDMDEGTANTGFALQSILKDQH